MKSIGVFGLSKSGKTSLIRAAIRIVGEISGKKIAGFKPFDKGLIRLNAEESKSDAELIREEMDGKPHISLVNPYHANENLPFEMALERDGYRAKAEILKSRKSILENQYHRVLIEGLQGVAEPLTPSTLFLDWAKENCQEVIWILRPEPGLFEANLAQLILLAQTGLSVHAVLNNAGGLRNPDVIQYCWRKVEDVLEKPVLGLIPFSGEMLGEISDKFLTGVRENLFPHFLQFF